MIKLTLRQIIKLGNNSWAAWLIKSLKVALNHPRSSITKLHHLVSLMSNFRTELLQRFATNRIGLSGQRAIKSDNLNPTRIRTQMMLLITLKRSWQWTRHSIWWLIDPRPHPTISVWLGQTTGCCRRTTHQIMTSSRWFFWVLISLQQQLDLQANMDSKYPIIQISHSSSLKHATIKRAVIMRIIRIPLSRLGERASYKIIMITIIRLLYSRKLRGKKHLNLSHRLW